LGCRRPFCRHPSTKAAGRRRPAFQGCRRSYCLRLSHRRRFFSVHLLRWRHVRMGSTAATVRNCSGGQLGDGGRCHGGLQALAGLQAHGGTDGKGYGVIVYGKCWSAAWPIESRVAKATALAGVSSSLALRSRLTCGIPFPPLINFLCRKHILRIRPSTEFIVMENNHQTSACYPARENTLPSTRKHEILQQKPFPLALKQRVLAFQPPWARFASSRR
jgi:hypothetical protein